MSTRIFVVFAVASVVVLSCKPFPRGEQLYTLYCSDCHMDDGTGLAGLIPPLSGSDYLDGARQIVPCVIYQGAEGGTVVNGIKYTEPMPAFSNFNEVDISNIINYLHSSWDNDLPLTSPEEVKSALLNCGVE